MGKPRMPMGGMGNMQNMMKQAKKMQQDMLKAQEDLEACEFETSSGGGAVVVKISGSKEILSVKIDPEVVQGDDVEMLEDLVLVAVNDALKKVDDVNKEKMSMLTGGLNIPGMF